jgi:hypothetical protein
MRYAALLAAGVLWLNGAALFAQSASTPPLSAAGNCQTAPEVLCCCPCANGSDCSNFYTSAEYLLWWIKAAPVPTPLLTASTNAAVNSRAILGDPGTVVLFGGQNYDFGAFSGGRLTAGWQLNPDVAIEASGFLLQQQSRVFTAKSDAIGNPVLATPFFDVVGNQEFSSFYSLPTPDGGSAGFSITQTSQLWSAESNLVARLAQTEGMKLSVLAGFRYLDLREKLHIDNIANFFAPTPIFDQATFPSFSHFLGFDSFDTHNQFYGGQVGAQAEFRSGCWLLAVQTKVAVGSTHEVLSINGATLSVAPGNVPPPLVVPGDAYALSSNIGRHSKSEFAVAPEVRLNVAYQVTDAIQVFAGYNFLYLSNVLRPGDQIDRRWNPSLIPTFGVAPTGPAFPQAILRQGDFFAQGLNFGVGLTF